MTAPNLSWIASYIWGSRTTWFAMSRVHGKYSDGIFPRTLLRRLNAVLELTRQAGLDRVGALGWLIDKLTSPGITWVPIR